MLQGLYSAAASMDAADLQHTIVSRNLANVNVPGFRRMFVHHESNSGGAEEGEAADTSGYKGVGSPQVAIDFTAGPTKRTERKLDVSLMGEGFFAVEGPSGPLYTRSGSFHVNNEGFLVTNEGLKVLNDDGGNIQLRGNAAEGDVSISSGGRVSANGVPLGILQRVDFDDRRVLISQGASLFEAPGEAIPKQVQTAVQTGMLEQSNVNPATELVLMLTGMRQYEAAQRTLSTMGNAMRERIDLGRG